MFKTVKLSRNASFDAAIEMQVQFQTLKGVFCTSVKTGTLHSAAAPQVVPVWILLSVVTGRYRLTSSSKQGQSGRPGILTEKNRDSVRG